MLISSLFFENHVIPSVMLLRDEHKNPSIFTLLCRGGGGGGVTQLVQDTMTVSTVVMSPWNFMIAVGVKTCILLLFRFLLMRRSNCAMGFCL